MPLDRVKGEHIEGLGLAHQVSPLYRWADTPYWGIACDKAREHFAKAGAVIIPEFSAEDISVQVYDDLPMPITDQNGNVFRHAVAFLFSKATPVAVWKRTEPGSIQKDLIARVVIGIDDRQKSELEMSGRWPKKAVN